MHFDCQTLLARFALWSVPLYLLLAGCATMLSSREAERAPPMPNPLEVTVTDHEFAWNQIVDMVDDYFPIAREERVRLIGSVLTEGRIETKTIPGATVMEYFRRDSTPGFERWHGTFQSIRRQAEVRVVPSPKGYAISIMVRKELEDVDRPEMSQIGSAVQRHDGSLIRPRNARVGGSISLGWIPIGRDTALEQKMLADLYARFYHVETPPPLQSLHHQLR